MSPIDYTKAFTDFWASQNQAAMKAQAEIGQAFATGMQALTFGKMPGVPGLPVDLTAGTADLTRASQSMLELWTAATALSGKLARAFPGAGKGDATIEATFQKIVDPRTWMGGSGEMDDVLGRMAEGPRFADLWEVERLYARVLQAWMTVRRRGLEHNAVVLGAWLGAGRRFIEELAGMKPAGDKSGDAKPLDGKAALALWTDTANRQLLETQRSEPFLQTQAAMIRASTELRLVQQELVEHFGKQYGFPSRTEMDDVHRTVTELRREMRAMRREQRALAELLVEHTPVSDPALSDPSGPEPATASPAATKRAPASRPVSRRNASQRGMH